MRLETLPRLETQPDPLMCHVLMRFETQPRLEPQPHPALSCVLCLGAA